MKKILLLGPEVTDFLNPMARKLLDRGYKVDLLENRKIPRNNDSISGSYSNIIDYKKFLEKRISAGKAIRYLFTIEFYKKLLATIFFNCLEGKCRILKSVRNTVTYKHNKEIFSPILDEYDIINFHSLTPGTLSFINYIINPHTKIILSFWGSDLFQVWGFESEGKNKSNKYYEQLTAMKRADLITVHSYEMERAVIAKYGPGMKNKIVRALFGIKDDIFNLIDDAKKSNSDNNFLSKYNIPENKIKVTVGYCGDPICNHLPTLDEIEKIDRATKEKLHLLVPMTYGNFTNEYVDTVIQKLNDSKVSYTIFDKFLSIDDLVKLRVTSDIMVMMNKSDALSASVSEEVYAGNILISAIWLPYSPLRLEKIFFFETDFGQLAETLIYVVNNYNDVKVKSAQNPERIKNLTASNKTLRKWINIFESLQQN